MVWRFAGGMMGKEAFETFLAGKPGEFVDILAARVADGTPGWTKYQIRYQITRQEYIDAVLHERSRRYTV